MSRSMNFQAVFRDDGEKYLFLYDNCAESRDALLAKVNEFVEDSELSFTSSDAETIGRGLRKLAQQHLDASDE